MLHGRPGPRGSGSAGGTAALNSRYRRNINQTFGDQCQDCKWLNADKESRCSFWEELGLTVSINRCHLMTPDTLSLPCRLSLCAQAACVYLNLKTVTRAWEICKTTQAFIWWQPILRNYHLLLFSWFWIDFHWVILMQTSLKNLLQSTNF